MKICKLNTQNRPKRNIVNFSHLFYKQTPWIPNPTSYLRELVEGGNLSGLHLILELLNSLNNIILTADVILNDARELNVADTESQRLNVAGLRPLASLDGGSLDLLEQGLEIGGVVHGLDVNDHQGLLDLLVGGLLLLSLSTDLGLHLSSGLVVLVIIITEEILVVILFLLLLLLLGGSHGLLSSSKLQLELGIHNGESTIDYAINSKRPPTPCWGKSTCE